MVQETFEEMDKKVESQTKMNVILDHLKECIIITSPQKIEFVNDEFLL